MSGVGARPKCGGGRCDPPVFIERLDRRLLPTGQEPVSLTVFERLWLADELVRFL